MTPSAVFTALQALRQKKPVVHNITNFVAMQISANVLLSLGASPIMAHEENELAEITDIANALVINIGTLDKNWLRAMRVAQTNAQQKQIPIILDPVGAGATSLRTQEALEFLRHGIQILRGNASEIMSLVDSSVITKGVDSTEKSASAITAAKHLAQKYHCVVVVSGEVDIVTDGARVTKIENGTPYFTRVTAMGCSVSAVVGAFAATMSNYFDAAVCAMSVFSLAGEKAAHKSQGPGSFAVHLLDDLWALSSFDFEDVKINAS